MNTSPFLNVAIKYADLAIDKSYIYVILFIYLIIYIKIIKKKIQSFQKI